jgi:multidrug efflux pump subunit AcrA (membrane-fusion protein)
MNKFLAILVLAVALPVLAQQPPAATKEITVKSSASQDTLLLIAKQLTEAQKTLNTKFQQAQTSLSENQKTLTAAIVASQNELNEKLKQDKKYAPILDKIDQARKALNSSTEQAQAAFSRDAGTLQNQVNMYAAQMEGIKIVVKKGQSLPDDAVFDSASGKWMVPVKDAPVAKK